MKRVIIFIIVGLVMFGIGFGGGIVMGRSMASGDENAGGSGGKVVDVPGPIVSLGEFTSNLAGSGRHVITFGLSLEALNDPSAATLSGVWLPRIKNTILLLVKDKIYEDLTSAEGALQFAEEIKRALNSQLPETRGEVPVVRVLFDSFVLQ
jgi:flagellar basal body-associated protein FliL